MPGEPLLLRDYDYELPEELIAQTPVEPRDASRLLVLDRASGQIEHRVFGEIGDYLAPGDLLVVNDTRVLPARLHGHRPSGGEVEILLLARRAPGLWEALVRPGRRLRPGAEVVLAASDGSRSESAVIEAREPEGLALVRLPAAVEEDLPAFGEMPLPPYIHQRLADPERYQTVYAEHRGSAAAPTAGLHFTPELLANLQRHGVELARLTLHVGIGTFRPVKVEDARRHEMHAEWFHVPPETLAAIRRTKLSGGRVVAVGTTSCRTLESLDLAAPVEQAQSGWTGLFITPGHRFQVVDELITNFHLPRSTLLLLVSALAGRETILAAYREAVRLRYRFYSLGDAMLIR
ncbi:MAG TPA: tRNA preQ1(34) S-adenosylmethionine ribosyltransferase-isomerase QueA [Thermomicrobiaceae bacterium]|nr:tRNA preQ1(34) S-adenosylmethionine ribosyltransferase-isomerase QueA [Thermomicrobiaceae bacterium]